MDGHLRLSSDCAPLSADHEAIDKQQDDRADHGSDQPCAFARTIPAEGCSKVSRNEGTNDSEDDRSDAAAVQDYGLGKRPSGVYLSTAEGSSRDNLARISS